MAILAPPEPSAAATMRSPVGLTDAELVADVRRGSDRAFEELYARYHRRIAAYVHGMVGDYGRAEDIAQDVFMSALRRMRDTDREIAFKPWLYEIAKNACIDQFRRARRTQEVSYDADEGLGGADYGRLVAVGPLPDAAVDQKMAIDNLRGAFGGLSATHHEILVMRELEGLSYREIGKRLGMSRASVESTLFRARRRLGEEYQELVSGERCLRVQDIIVAAGAAVPGVRDQRRMAAHLSHCQPCRRHAKVAGLDAAALVAPRGVRAKIAALVPLPAFLRRRWFDEELAPATANHHVGTLAQLTAQLGSSVDPAVASWAKAAGMAAVLAAAGVTGGAAVTDETRTDTLGRPGAVERPVEVRATAAPRPVRAARAAGTLAVSGVPLTATAAPTRLPAAAPAARGTTAKGAPAASGSPGAAPGGPTPPGAGVVPGAPTPPAPESSDLTDRLDPSKSPTGSGRPGGSSNGVAVPDEVTTAAAGLDLILGDGDKAQLEDAAAAAAKATQDAGAAVGSALLGG